MSSVIREGSNFDGQPVAYFRFIRGDMAWCYTSSDRFETLHGETYQPAAIKRSAIRQGSEKGGQGIKVTLPADLPVAGNWRPFAPSEPINLVCYTRHEGEEDALVDWVGRVVASAFTADLLELSCEPSRTLGVRRGGNRRWQIGCDLPLYSQGVGMCNLDPEPLEVSAEIESVTGLTLRSTAFAAEQSGYFAGGMVRWTRADGLHEVRTIREHQGDGITLDYGALDLAPGLVVRAYPGCAHTWSACGKHNNQENYGGNLHMPLDNPYNGNPIW